MKLNVDHFKIAKIDDVIIQDILSIIDEDDWNINNYRKTASNMLDTDSIPILHTPLCASGINSLEAIRSIRKEVLYDKYFPKVEPVLDILREYYTFKQYAIFISRLHPHKRIGMHQDSGKFLELCHRIHLPLQTNDKIFYVIENNKYNWERANLYEFDNLLNHGVENNSDEHRIHLIINLYNIPEEDLTKA